MFDAIIQTDKEKFYLKGNKLYCAKDNFLIIMDSTKLMNKLRYYFINCLKLDTKEKFFEYLNEYGTEGLDYKKDKGSKDLFTRIINIAGIGVLIVNTFLLSTLIYEYTNKDPISFIETTINSINEDYNSEYMYKKIEESNLDEEYKELLLNKDYLEFLEENCDIKNVDYALKITDIQVLPFEERKLDEESTIGYYNALEPNILRLREEDEYQKVVGHEFIHLTESLTNYVYLKEAATEQLNKEFFYEDASSYSESVKRICILMEIIGPEPILEVIYNNDDTLLIETVKEYIDDFDIYKLKKCLQEMDYDNPEKNDEKFDVLLQRLYEKKYSKDITDDEIIQGIYNGTITDRGYFNEKYINEHNIDYSIMK